jgi:hypothetical protein
MDFNFATDRIAQVLMITYTSKIITNFPKPSPHPAQPQHRTTSSQYAKKSRPNSCQKKKAQAFHHTVAQLLFLSKRSRQDIQTAVSFLTTRVKLPDKDDWGRVKRVLRYLRGSRHMKLNLSAENITCVCWWVDASHAVHDNCKGHTGEMMSLGTGAAIRFSKKTQK